MRSDLRANKVIFVLFNAQKFNVSLAKNNMHIDEYSHKIVYVTFSLQILWVFYYLTVSSDDIFIALGYNRTIFRQIQEFNYKIVVINP